MSRIFASWGYCIHKIAQNSFLTKNNLFKETARTRLFLQSLLLDKIYKKNEFRPIMEKEIEVSIVLPTYNESMNIPNLVNRIDNSLALDKEIIIVDDNSPDKTWEIAEKLKNKNVRVIRRIEERGLVTAIQKGIDEAKGKYIVWMDADGSMPPEKISEMISLLKEHDVVVGSRYAKGGKDQRTFLRVASSRFINLAANVILNFKVLDYDSGFVAAKKEVLKEFPLDKKAAYGDYCIKFLYNAGKKYKVKEIPFTFIDRSAGESKTASSLTGLFKFGILYLKMIVDVRRGK